ncbi:MFS domain-containing protein [Trichostrongylus colubriformis]|uniref:MFS domain-containing protein n=1 Tax=Trichostrongylus colubriformis TaxID=6319 RepID=A0AAN8IAB4_TRICO
MQRESSWISQNFRLNPHSIFITLSMAFLWCLSAMPTMSPAYMSPPTACLYNCTFVVVQEEFQLQRTAIDPAEMTSSVYFLGNLLLGQMYCMAADRIGRRPVLVWSLLVSGLAGTLAAFASNFYVMLFGRFIQGSFFNVIHMLL